MDWVIYQIMPNHFHAIIELKNLGVDQLISPVGATLRVALFEQWLPRVALSAKRSSS